MATVKLKFRPSTVSGKPGTLCYQVTERRLVRLLATEFKIMPSEWDDKRTAIVIPSDGERADTLRAIRSRCQWDMERILQIVSSLRAKGVDFTTDTIIAEFQRIITENTLFRFMAEVTARLEKLGQTRTAQTYRQAQRSFSKFRGGEDVMLEHIDSDLMDAYQAWLKASGAMPNTISFYCCIFRGVYNRAVDKGLTSDRRPFRHCFTGLEKTVKRAVPLKILRKIRDLDLSRKPSLNFARDIFMFSFYTRGMSLIDIAALATANLSNVTLTYRRRKTGQQLIIRWEQPMQDILDKWPNPCNDRLLPLITDLTRERNQYTYRLHSLNHHLKTIAEMVGLPTLTLYAARHSWASIAKQKNVPLSVISEGMGHDNETTTQIYLASLSTDTVDRANSMIINSL